MSSPLRAGAAKVRTISGARREGALFGSRGWSACVRRAGVESLLAAFVDGRIDRETLDGELANEKRVLRAELLAVRAIGKRAAQDAANAFFDVIESALAAGIDGLV